MGIQGMGRDERQSPIYLQSRINVRDNIYYVCLVKSSIYTVLKERLASIPVKSGFHTCKRYYAVL